MKSNVCPRCLYIRPKGQIDCACTVRMAALERALREVAPDSPAFKVNEQLAATDEVGKRYSGSPIDGDR